MAPLLAKTLFLAVGSFSKLYAATPDFSRGILPWRALYNACLPELETLTYFEYSGSSDYMEDALPQGLLPIYPAKGKFESGC